MVLQQQQALTVKQRHPDPGPCSAWSLHCPYSFPSPPHIHTQVCAFVPVLAVPDAKEQAAGPKERKVLFECRGVVEPGEMLVSPCFPAYPPHTASLLAHPHHPHCLLAQHPTTTTQPHAHKWGYSAGGVWPCSWPHNHTRYSSTLFCLYAGAHGTLRLRCERQACLQSQCS